MGLRKLGAHEPSAFFLHELEQFVRKIKPMLDRVGTAQDDVPRRLSAHGVDRDDEAGRVGLFDRRPDLIHRIIVDAVVGDELDSLGAVVDIFPDRFSDLID
jgi:hypothetical protein